MLLRPSTLDFEDRPLKLISISHGWLTPDHPDPYGEQLVKFANVVARERAAAASKRWAGSRFVRAAARAARAAGLPGVHAGAGRSTASSAERAAAFPSGEFMAFYDFASLHQKDPETGGRTGEEKTAFDSALGTMGTWYAHDKATTVALDVFPAGWDSTTPYKGPRMDDRRVGRERARPRVELVWVGEIRARERGQGAGLWQRAPASPSSGGVCGEAGAQGLHQRQERPRDGRRDLPRTLDGAFGGAEVLEFAGLRLGRRGGEGVGKSAAAREERDESLSHQQPKIRADGWRALAEAIAAGGAPRLEIIGPCAIKLRGRPRTAAR